MIEKNERLLTPNDLADLLQINKGTIYAWRSKGEGPPALLVGRNLRWRRADIERWIAGGGK